MRGSLRRLVVLLATVIPVGARAQSSGPKFVGRLIGVYDDVSGAPIDSAEVRDMVSGNFALTTSTGTLTLFFVDTAGSLIRIRKIGYAPVTQFIANSPSDRTPVTITLQPTGQVLPTVNVTEAAVKYTGRGLQGFEERRHAGGGWFVSEAQIRKEEDRTVGNLVQGHIPGVTVSQTRLNASIAYSRRMGALCPVDVLIDGMPLSLRPGSDASKDLNQFQASNLAGIEFHSAATLPPEFPHTSAGCGVLMLWTRER